MKFCQAIAAIAACCVTALHASPSYAAAGQADVQSLERRWAAAFNHGNVAALSRLYDRDAWLVLPGMPPVQGKEAIRHALAGMTRHAAGLALTTTKVHALGRDFAVENGTSVLRDLDHAGALARANYQVVWHRRNGRWLIFRDVVSPL